MRPSPRPISAEHVQIGVIIERIPAHEKTNGLPERTAEVARMNSNHCHVRGPSAVSPVPAAWTAAKIPDGNTVRRVSSVRRTNPEPPASCPPVPGFLPSAAATVRGSKSHAAYGAVPGSVSAQSPDASDMCIPVFCRGQRSHRRLEGHAAFRTISGTFLAHLGIHGTDVLVLRSFRRRGCWLGASRRRSRRVHGRRRCHDFAMGGWSHGERCP